jgi:terminase large subunit-like protein
MARRKVSFLAFFLIWADHRKWKVPALHVRMCHWLENRGEHAVLRVFRGAGKSTVLAIYNAWRYYVDPTYRILHQGSDDGTAYKTSRDTQNVLRNHPLTKDLLPNKPGQVEQWWVEGAEDARNASMYARGIMSNVTSARCDEAQNDDVEVPRNIQTAEAREKLRYRLGEQIHIMVPGARQLFIGTPHTHDSLYDEHERLGADCLTVRMFEHEFRIEQAKAAAYDVGFVPEIVFSGMGEQAKVLKAGADYRMDGTRLIFARPPGTLVDCYAGSSWPERFDAAELVKRRRRTRTVNEWDSQYQLHSKPVTETRLNPDRIKAYDIEPVLRVANGELAMWLGNVRIVGASCKWDPSSGKLKSDASSLAIVLQDDQGRRYWHRALRLTGEVAEFDPRGKTITGGQVHQIVAVVKQLALPRVTVETNGAGTFGPAVLKAALKQARLQCGVSEKHETLNKNKRILEAIEPPLSSGTLWAHVSVLDGPAYDQMRDFNPAITEQPDDDLDSLAGAISEAPERIGRVGGWNSPQEASDDWRPSAGIFEVELET